MKVVLVNYHPSTKYLWQLVSKFSFVFNVQKKIYLCTQNLYIYLQIVLFFNLLDSPISQNTPFVLFKPVAPIYDIAMQNIIPLVFPVFTVTSHSRGPNMMNNRQIKRGFTMNFGRKCSMGCRWVGGLSKPLLLKW